ncbi:hypothetical protein HPP92_013897 [Vanilla planifolia]|uniref:RING-type E3 ubiquitin transferase n=1 Tax=Vanilla planifolia TaxID=51239 RepID=A0A835R3B7_VANPL|nr:hypothetical protein HPP92_013897 [Vanilla planifolia]
MTSPPPSSSPAHTPPTSSNKLDYYYFVVGLALVAAVLLITNAVAVGCCSWFRRVLSDRGLIDRAMTEEDVRRWIPAQRYSKKQDEQGGGGGGVGGGDTPECVVCLPPLTMGEEVRQMPQCGHSFHAACIDMWLYSHSSCPVCRGSVLPTPTNSIEMSARFNSQEVLIPQALASSSGM